MVQLLTGLQRLHLHQMKGLMMAQIETLFLTKKQMKKIGLLGGRWSHHLGRRGRRPHNGYWGGQYKDQSLKADRDRGHPQEKTQGPG